MAFLTTRDYLAQISQEDLLTLTEPDGPTEPEAPEVLLLDDDEDDDPDASPAPAPAPEPTTLQRAEANAMAEVASYLRGRYDMETAYALAGPARNAQLVMVVVDVTLWNLVPRVTFRAVSEIRETRYKAAIAWLKLVEAGKSNPDLPHYAATGTPNPNKYSLFRVTSQPARSHNF